MKPGKLYYDLNKQRDIVNLASSGKASLRQIAKQNHIQISQIHKWRETLDKHDKTFGKSKKQRARKKKAYKKNTVYGGKTRIDKDVEKIIA